jgi:hypothetical protein
MYEFCTDDLKAKIAPKRKRLQEIEEKRMEEEGTNNE